MKVSLKYILNHFNQPIKVIFEFKDLNKICTENDSKSSHKGSLTNWSRGLQAVLLLFKITLGFFCY